MAGVDAVKSHGAAHEIIEKSLRMPDGSITAMFEHVKGRGKVMYSHKTTYQDRITVCSHSSLYLHVYINWQYRDCLMGSRKHVSFKIVKD